MNNKYTELLSNEFIAKYSEFPEHMNALGKFVFYRTYSRFLPEKGRQGNVERDLPAFC
jgi:ribonucleoside-triphosphate reductase